MEVGLTTWQAPAEATVSAQHWALVSITPSEKWLPKTQSFTSLSLVYFSIYLIIAQITEQFCLFVLYTASLESAENFRLIKDFKYMDFVGILCNGLFCPFDVLFSWFGILKRGVVAQFAQCGRCPHKWNTYGNLPHWSEGEGKGEHQISVVKWFSSSQDITMSAHISCQIQLSIPGLNLLPHLLSFSFEGTSLPMQRQQSVEDPRMKTQTFASSPVAWRITRTSGTLCLFLQRRHLCPDPHLRHLRPAS